MSSHLKIGDLLHNPENGALGLITRITRGYFYFYLMSYDSEEKSKFLISEDRAKKIKVYESIDNSILMVYHGTNRRRRKRKTFYKNLENKSKDNNLDVQEIENRRRDIQVDQKERKSCKKA